MMRALFALALCLAPVAAQADIAPPDSCGEVGAACTSAPPDYRSPGICTKKTCSRATPNGTHEYECRRCVAQAKPKK